MSPLGGTPLTPLGAGQAPRLKKVASLAAPAGTNPRAATRYAPLRSATEPVPTRTPMAAGKLADLKPMSQKPGANPDQGLSCGTSPRQASRFKVRSSALPADQGGTGDTAKAPPRSRRCRHPKTHSRVNYPGIRAPALDGKGAASGQLLPTGSPDPEDGASAGGKSLFRRFAYGRHVE